MRNFILMLAVIILTSCIGSNVLAAGPKKIRKCMTIKKSGSYVVTKNLQATMKTDGHCITIDADFVTLDLGGFTLKGLDEGIGFGVWDNNISHTNVVVRNGNITQFLLGMSLYNCNVGTIENIAAFDNTLNGINTGSAFIVTENKALDNGNTGIQVNAGSLVKNNISRGNIGNGFYFNCPVNSIGNMAMENISTNYYNAGVGCQSANNL